MRLIRAHPVKFTIAGTLLSALCLAIVYIALHPVPVVLMFHSVTDDPDPASPHVTANRFHALVKQVKRGTARVEITTDSSDGGVYSDFYRTLRDEGLTATVFLLPLAIGGKDSLSWPQVLEMDRAGFTIGSHGLLHPWLPDLTDKEITCELCLSKALIEEKLGHKVTTLAYPYGAFDERVQRIARQCGYERAYATAPGRRHPDDAPLGVKRVYANDALLRNPVLTWLALSELYVPARESVLALLPISLPRKPDGWSHALWLQEARGIKDIAGKSPYCPTIP